MGAMTLLESRPILRVNPSVPRPSRPIAVTAMLAAAGCAAAGLVVALAVAVAGWFAADSGSFAGAIRVGALGWLVAQGSGLHIDGTAAATGLTVTAIPVGGLLLAGWLLYRAGRWVGSTTGVASPSQAVVATVAMTVAYTAIGVLVSGAGDLGSGASATDPHGRRARAHRGTVRWSRGGAWRGYPGRAARPAAR